MCCSTGVCGPSVDKELLRVATIINSFNKKGADIVRHNLASEPQAFIANEKVNLLLNLKGGVGKTSSAMYLADSGKKSNVSKHRSCF